MRLTSISPRRILLLAALAVFFCPAKAQLTFSGNIHQAVTEIPDASSGLSAVYVLERTDGVTASYASSSSSNTVRWFKFSALGGGYAEEVAATRQGNVSSIRLTAEDLGYIVEEGTSRKCYWVTNYANHICELRDLSIAPEQDCMSASLIFSGNADRITYYTVNGVARTLSRGLTLEYTTLVYDPDRNAYLPTVETRELEYVTGEVHAPAPLCQTDFLLTGEDSYT